MRLIRRPQLDTRVFPDGCVATVGTFDGLHVGHQEILSRLKAEAGQRGLPAVVVSFDPTPREFFSPPGTSPARLMRFREKFARLNELGIDGFYCAPFNAWMAALEPTPFVESLLVNLLGVQHMVVGDDFRYARRRAGDIDTLKASGEALGFSVEQVGSVLLDGERVSSTRVREMLAAGDMHAAAELLGRYFRMSGRVVSGKTLGRTLGFPTANIRPGRRVLPANGIFAVRVLGLDAEPLNGVANVGTRPTVDGDEPLLEVHVFDFDRDIYGRYIEVEFVAKLRDEERFPDLQTMTEQMHVDAEQARAILAAA